MTVFHRTTVTALFALLSLQGCREAGAIQNVNVSMKNTANYQYSTVGGDEDGARVSMQAKHFSLSEIRRDTATAFVATYVYQPAPGFVGSDYAEVEVLTGSDGASQPNNIKTIAFHFVVHD